MRKLHIGLLALFLVFSVGLMPAYASVGTQEDGTEEGAAVCLNFSTGLDSSGGTVKTVTVDLTELTMSDADYQDVDTAGMLADPYKKETTDETAIVAADSSRIYICMEDTTFQLPAASDGLIYTFVSGAAVEIEIQVETTPATILLAFDDTNGQGKIETMEETTGNTMTLVSDGTDWYAMNWTPDGWTDGGEWEQLDLGSQ